MSTNAPQARTSSTDKCKNATFTYNLHLLTYYINNNLAQSKLSDNLHSDDRTTRAVPPDQEVRNWMSRARSRRETASERRHRRRYGRLYDVIDVTALVWMTSADVTTVRWSRRMYIAPNAARQSNLLSWQTITVFKNINFRETLFRKWYQ